MGQGELPRVQAREGRGAEAADGQQRQVEEVPPVRSLSLSLCLV